MEYLSFIKMKFAVFCFAFLCLSKSQALIDEDLNIFVDFLDEIKSSTGIIFYCDKSFKAEKFKTSQHKYFSFFDFSKNNLTEIGLNSVMSFNYHKIGIVTDLSCSKIEVLFNALSEFNYFNASYYWLLLSDNFQAAVKLMERQNINLDAEITLAIATDKNNFTLFDVYKPSHKYHGELIVTPKGTYSEEFNINLTQSKFQRRIDLSGIKINVGIIATAVKKNQTLIEYLENCDEFLVDVQHRHHYQLFKVLAEKHNFSYFLHHGAFWGFNRSGIMELFSKNQIEFSISPIRTSPERLNLVDFSVTTWITTPTITFRHPKNSLRNAFLQPLSPWVWNLILIIIFVATILITLTMRSIKGSKNLTLIRAFMTSVGVMCQQGFIENFNRLSTRIVLLVLIFFSQIIYQFYSSFIVGSLLTMPPKTINNLRQLIDSNLQVGIEDLTYNTDFFQTSNERLTLELYNKKVHNGKSGGNFYSLEDGITLMKKGRFAYHFDTSYGYKIIVETFSNDEICELHQMLLFPQIPLSVSVIKRSPFKELIMVEMLRFSENGILNYYNSKWQTKKPKCESSVTKIKAVDLDDASWILILLSVTILFSFVVVIFENIHYFIIYFRKTKKK